MGKNDDKAKVFEYYWNIFALTQGTPISEPWVREHNFDAAWKRNHRFDFARPDKMIAVEVDGGQFAAGGGRHNTDTDREKLNIAAALGWRVFRFSVQQLEKDPGGCVDLVAGALR